MSDNKNRDDLLEQNQNAVSELEAKHGSAASGIVENSKNEARRWMNAMKTVGSALKRSISENSEDQAKHFKSILSSTELTAKEIALLWGIDPTSKKDRWIINMIEKSIVDSVDFDDKNYKDFAIIIAQKAKDSAAETPIEAMDAWSNKNMIDVAIFKGMVKLSSDQNKYNFERSSSNKIKDLELLRDVVLNSSYDALSSFCLDITPTNEKITFMSMLIEQHFDIMSASWNKLAEKASEAGKKVTKDQFKAWKLANPEGFSLDPVVKDFSSNANRLVRLTTAARKNDKVKKS